MKRNIISDVAKLAGVSASTISNFLNGKYENMSLETRKRVEKVVMELNYTPNISARRLSAKEKCGVICLIIPVNISEIFSSFYYPTVISAVGKASAVLDYTILIYIRRGKDRSKEIEYLKGMYGTITDGFIMFDLVKDDFYFMEFEQARIPYVCVGKHHNYDNYHYVASDHEQVVADAVEHLVELGHHKIALIYEQGSSVVLELRYAGFEKAMLEHGCPVKERYIASPRLNESGPEEIRATVEGLLLQEDPPTAVISSMTFAPDIEQVCAAAGREIPGDLSVVLLYYVDGFNLRLGNYTHSRQLADVAAQHAFYGLLEQIRNPDEPFHSEMLPLTLIPGDSTAPPRKNNL